MMFLYTFVDFVNKYLKFFFIKNSSLLSLNICKITFNSYLFANNDSFLLILSIL